MMDKHRFIDKVPEFPYFLLAAIYFFKNPLLDYVHIFSASFIFLAITVLIGTTIKVTFKTKRPKPYKTIKIFSYGFPSLHSLVSMGAISFTYFIDPVISVVLVPVGIFYLYSRIVYGVHTGSDVVGGAFIGAAIGAVLGYVLLDTYLPGVVERLFAIAFFIVPTATTYLRIKSVL